ncbi:mitochondrial thiamine pyrophosphate carrier [Plutella xylostella]|uniref:mitochondrial thiamine pyrophosphate carrier n=1 Tax=Plutella xylostella TaxID=51655 RepID=UPI0020326580|nr:mitochondrial thiamine pyrophosphate carrier [Plutella xylostella]
MVGFQQQESLSPNQKILAGVVSGTVTRFVTQPLDVVKITTQLTRIKSDKVTSYKVARYIWRKEGPPAFFKGHILGQIHSILFVSTQFYVFEVTTKYCYTHLGDKHKRIQEFCCGLCSGCLSTVAVMPVEVVRVRQMIVRDGRYRGLAGGARAVYRRGGVLAFYEGLGASLLQIGPTVGIAFSTFTFTQKKMLRYLKERGGAPERAALARGNLHRADHLLYASVVAGSLSGLVSKTLTYPMDLAKRRMQIASHPGAEDSPKKKLIRCQATIWNCLTTAFRKEGLRGLYRGWSVTIYKAQLTSVIAFTTYELVCYGIRDAIP